MNNTSERTTKRWKVILNVVTIVALVVLVFFLRHDIAATVHNLKKVSIWALLLMIPIEALNYHAQAKLYQGLFDMVGNKLKYKFLYETALELNFVNNIFPSGGVSGISYFGVRMRSDKISAGKATVVQLFKLVLVFLSFEALLIVGLLFMAVGGRVNSLTILVATAISTLMVVGTLVFIYIIGSKARINAAFSFVTRLLNNLIHVVRPNHPETIEMAHVKVIVNELHDNYRLIKDNIKQLKVPFIYALIANMSEVLAIYVVYIAFGHWVNLGSVILAYAVANVAGFISVLPGGIGVYEAIMTGVLAIAGVPASLSIPVVIMYRILNTIIQLPPGYYFYHRTLHGGGRTADNG